MHVAVDGSGNVYFDEEGSDAIWKWNATTGISLVFRQPGTPLEGVAVDAAGNVYSIGLFNSFVYQWNAATGHVATLVSSGLSSPTEVAVDGSGNVYIADTGDNTIKEWNAQTGQLTTLVSSGLNSPQGVAVDGSGNLYIADTNSRSIKEVPRAFVPNGELNETAGAGPAATPLPVLPTTQSLAGAFAPTSDQSWLTIDGATNGVIDFSLTENTTAEDRFAGITVLGVPIRVVQFPPQFVSTLADNGNGSLRDLVNSDIENAVGIPSLSDVIVIPQSLFTAPVAGQPDPNTIRLASELPLIPSNLNLEIRAEVEVSDSGPEFTVSAQGLGSVIQVQVGGSLTLENLILTDGNAGTEADGGAVVNHGTLTLTNSAITDSSAREGGGIANDGTLHLVSSLVSGNQATLAGGGVFSLDGAVTIEQSTISDNTVTAQDTTSSNLPTGGGGLFAVGGGTVSVTGSTVSANTAKFVSFTRGHLAFFTSGGGGIAVQDGTTLALTDSVVSDNIAELLGGGVLVHNAFATVTRSSLVRNIADAGVGLANIGYDSQDE